MSPSSVAIPRFLLPQLSWKASNVSYLPIASRMHPSINGLGPLKPIRQSIRSTSRKCRHYGHAPSPSASHRQGPPFARYPFNTGQRFSTTPTLSRDHHFDTLKFVQRLKDEGFSEEQSKAMMLVLSDVIEESIQNLTRTMVLREGLQSSNLEHSTKFLLTTLVLQMPIEVPIRKRSTSPNFDPSFWPSIPAIHL